MRFLISRPIASPAGHFARVSFHGEGRAECRAECRVHLLFRAESCVHLLFRVQSRVPCAPSLAEQSAVCTFFSLLPVDLSALLWSVGFFSGETNREQLCFSPGSRLPEALFFSRLESKKLQKRVNLVDLVKSFKQVFTIYLQTSAYIQWRTSLSKFAKH